MNASGSSIDAMLSPYIGGKDLISQIVLTIVIVVIVSVIAAGITSALEFFEKRAQSSATLLADTTTGQQLVAQDPALGTPMVYNSENQQNGIEMTYSMFLLIKSETFDGVKMADGQTPTLKHVFHKGFKNAFPVMAPGVFVESVNNTLRVYMNSANSWNNYISIPNIPVGKWFHMIILVKGKYLDVYINGNVTQRFEFKDVPRLNYGNIYVMSPIQFTFPQNSTSSSPNPKQMQITGAIAGMVSRLHYYGYALTYSAIDALYRQGPSSTIVNSGSTDLPPYFHDDWWVNKSY